MSKIAFASEHELIFLCARLEIDGLRLHKIREVLLHPLNWRKAIEIAGCHKILPLLYFSLNKPSFQDIIPQDIFQQLANNYYSNLSRNIKIEKEIAALLGLLRSRGIDAIPFKGLSLVQTVYHNPALRIMDDVDILIKDRFEEIRNLLTEHGYQTRIDKISEAYRHKYQYEILFSKKILPDLSIHVEIHPAFAPARPHKINLPQLWARAKKVSLQEQETLCLSPEDAFLSLVLHLRRNTRTLNLKLIVDIAELLKSNRYNFDWAYVKASARSNHMVNAAYLALYLAKELLQVNVSCAVMNAFRPGLVKAHLVHFIVNRGNFLNFSRQGGILLRLLLFDSIKDFFLYLWRVSLLERFFAPRAFREKSTIRKTGMDIKDSIKK